MRPATNHPRRLRRNIASVDFDAMATGTSRFPNAPSHPYRRFRLGYSIVKDLAPRREDAIVTPRGAGIFVVLHPGPPLY